MLTWHLVEAGTVLTVATLVRAVAGDGFGLPHPADKAVSDALRWEPTSGPPLTTGVHSPAGWVAGCRVCG